MSAEREAERVLAEIKRELVDAGLYGIAADIEAALAAARRELAEVQQERDGIQLAYEGALGSVATMRATLAAKDEALRTLRDGYDDHEPTCAMFLPQRECDCAVGLIDAALTPEEPCYCAETSTRNCPRHANPEEPK